MTSRLKLRLPFALFLALATSCAYAVDCPTSVAIASPGATSDAWNTAGYCIYPPGKEGRGRGATLTALFENGQCMDCTDTTFSSSTNDEGFAFRIPPFCDMYTTARNVGANAFAGCPDPVLNLTNTCHRGRPIFLAEWQMFFVFDGSCNGAYKEIAVIGGWRTEYTPWVWEDDYRFERFTGEFDKIPLPADQWRYSSKAAVGPVPSLVPVVPSPISIPPLSIPVPSESITVLPPPPIAASTDRMPPASTSSVNTDNNTESSNAGVIAGAAVAAVAAASLILATGFFILRHKRKKESAGNVDAEHTTPPTKPNTSSIIDSILKSRQPSAPPLDSVVLVGSSGSQNTRSGSRASSATQSLRIDPMMSYIQSTLSTQSIQRGESGLKSHLEAWQINFLEITIEYPIGEGSFGRVYKAKWNHTDVAVKILIDAAAMDERAQGSHASHNTSLLEPSPLLMAKLNEEAQIMEKLHHPNIAQFLGLCSSPAALVIEYCAKGSLSSVLKKGLTDQTGAAAAEVTWTRRLNIAMDTVRGMLNLHIRSPNPILHKDLKSPNILISASWTAKITDFNLSKILEGTGQASSHAAMNPRWLAPEILDGTPASFASDVYAFGVCMWELLTWKIPYGISNPWGIVSSITRGERLDIPPKNELPGPQSGDWVHLDSYIQLMKRCWEHQPSLRPTFEEIGNELQQMIANSE